MKADPQLMQELVQHIAWLEAIKPYCRTQHDASLLKLMEKIRDHLAGGYTKEYVDSSSR